MKLRATLEQSGKTATGIEVPESVIESLAAGKRVPVSVTIGEHTYRSTIAPWQGRYMLPVSAENREAAGIEAGQMVNVEIAVDTAPRDVEVPADFAAALKKDPAARKFFNGLSVSNRKRFVVSIEGAKTEETRQRRIEKSVASLHEGKL